MVQGGDSVIIEFGGNGAEYRHFFGVPVKRVLEICRKYGAIQEEE